MFESWNDEKSVGVVWCAWMIIGQEVFALEDPMSAGVFSFRFSWWDENDDVVEDL